jgi:hypothetical protein
MRLRGPRGGWAPALAVFALLAPLLLVLTDILLVAHTRPVPVPRSC